MPRQKGTGAVKQRLLATVLIVSLLGGIAAVSASMPAVSTAGQASPVASPAASPVASPVIGRSVSVTDSVTITLYDGGFDPNFVQATNGHDLTITLINQGTKRHTFRIDRYRINVSLDPGERQTVTIQSPDLGDFTFYSDAPGDEAMTGTLTFYI